MRPAGTGVHEEGPMDINILKFLQAAPHLESLELIGLRVSTPPKTALVPIDLTRLAKIVTRNVEYGSLFVRATFLSLESLTIIPSKTEFRQRRSSGAGSSPIYYHRTQDR